MCCFYEQINDDDDDDDDDDEYTHGDDVMPFICCVSRDHALLQATPSNIEHK